jgi:hypothetical protein
LLNVPVAVKGCVLPAAIDDEVGVTAIETSTADVTVSVTPGEETPACAAEIVVVPAATPDATPAELIVAVEVTDDVQVTVDEIF